MSPPKREFGRSPSRRSGLAWQNRNQKRRHGSGHTAVEGRSATRGRGTLKRGPARITGSDGRAVHRKCNNINGVSAPFGVVKIGLVQ